MPLLRIENPGFLTTIQDRGRFGYQKQGVPVAGAMDEYALRVANLLVGNNENEGCLEITLIGPLIEFLTPGLVALTGADLGAGLNDISCPPWQSFQVRRGDRLHFTGGPEGCRAYLAAAGGFDIPPVLGSRSTYLRAGIGGLAGRALCAGDQLSVRPIAGDSQLPPRTVPADYRHEPVNPLVLRVVLGPQDDAFTRQGIQTFLQSAYTIALESDRMGCRLEGPEIAHKNSPDIISDGIAMGSIQVPGNRKPIIMLADRQTTGGYAKIATVITPDLWKPAQARPGEVVSFTPVTPEQAYEAYIAYENRLKLLPTRFIRL